MSQSIHEHTLELVATLFAEHMLSVVLEGHGSRKNPIYHAFFCGWSSTNGRISRAWAIISLFADVSWTHICSVCARGHTHTHTLIQWSMWMTPGRSNGGPKAISYYIILFTRSHRHSHDSWMMKWFTKTFWSHKRLYVQTVVCVSVIFGRRTNADRRQGKCTDDPKLELCTSILEYKYLKI